MKPTHLERFESELDKMHRDNQPPRLGSYRALKPLVFRVSADRCKISNKSDIVTVDLLR